MSAIPNSPSAPVVVVWYRVGSAQEDTIDACVRAVRLRAGRSPFELIVCRLDSEGEATTQHVDGIETRTFRGPRIAPALNRIHAEHPNRDLIRIRADIVIETNGWLDKFLELAETRPQVGVIGARLVSIDGRSRAIGRNILNGLGSLARYANRGYCEPDRYASRELSLDDVVETDSVEGKLAWYRAGTLQKVGGLDENYQLEGGEDDDFCMASRFVGYDVCVDVRVSALDLSAMWSATSYESYDKLGRALEHTRHTEQGLWNLHAKPWREKWGFDPRHPDLAEVRRLYGDTRICWRIGGMAWNPASVYPTVDVAIVTWNNAELMERCLRSLAKTDYPGRVVVHVTDNGSGDSTLEVLEDAKNWLPFELLVYPLPVNSGVTVGFNWSIVQGEGELVARLDDDVILPSDWLTKLVETMHRRPFAGCVGPKILNDNVRRTIQCGPFRMFPGTSGFVDEEDSGQADFVARCTHVRGCCNLYRRDVLDDVGLFDLRYAPSQWDDPDHHVAVQAAGYEVIYDGRVGVVHALTTGKGRTYAAKTNQLANRSKLDGKWGHKAWQILETALDTSRLGRLLPADEAAWAREQPSPMSYPRTGRVDPDPDDFDHAEKFLRYEDMVRRCGGALADVWSQVDERAQSMLRDGAPAGAVQMLLGVVDHVPVDPVFWALLAQAYVEIAMPEEARRYLRIARDLRPDLDWSSTAKLIDSAAVARSGGLVGDRTTMVGESRVTPISAVAAGDAKLKVLMTNTYLPRVAGGDMGQIKKVAESLRRAGVDVDVRYQAHPDPTGYDIVHVHNLWFPSQTLPQVKGIRTQCPNVPVALTPIYWDMAEKSWAEQAIPVIFDKGRKTQVRQAYLQALADGSLEIGGHKRSESSSNPYPGFEDYQRQIVKSVGWLLPQSRAEWQLIREKFEVDTPATLVTNGAERGLFEVATPDMFRQQFDVPRDFVLTVGLVEVRKNQLLLLEALRGTGVHTVVVGRNYDQGYLAHCREVGGPNVTFIEHMPHEVLASAMKAARVFALPSWMECAAIASLEAAVAGCPIVVGDRTSEKEVFGDAAYLCDPADVSCIRRAVLEAWQERDNPQVVAKRTGLQQRLAEECTWTNAARQTLEGYEGLLKAHGDEAKADLVRQARERLSDQCVSV